MSRQKERAEFEKNKVIYESAKLTFLGSRGGRCIQLQFPYRGRR